MSKHVVFPLIELVHSHPFEILCEELFGSLEHAEDELPAIEARIAQRIDEPDVLAATAVGQLRASEFDTSIGRLLFTYFHQRGGCIHLLALVPVRTPTDLEVILRLSVLAHTLAESAYRLVATHPDVSERALAAANALGYRSAEPENVQIPH